MPTAIGVHIFAGGFSIGVRKAGFEVFAHLEGEKYGVSTAKRNWPKMPIYVGEKTWPLPEFRGKVDFVYCNPPCAPWSTAGPSTIRGPEAWKTDPRLSMWRQCLRVFKEVQPRVYAMESITQAYSKGRELVDEFTTVALGLGYKVKHTLMDAKWTGIPQSRRRFFLIFHRPDIPLDLSFSFKEPPTVGDLLEKVKDPGHITERKTKSPYQKVYLNCLKNTPPGKRLRETYDRLYPDVERNERGVYPGRPGFLVHRLHPDQLIGAFIGDVFIHPIEDRLIGTNEMRALCGYPDWFEFDGPPAQHASLMARAVLPSVGEWLGKAVRKALDGKTSRSSAKVELIDLRSCPGERSNLTEEYDA